MTKTGSPTTIKGTKCPRVLGALRKGADRENRKAGERPARDRRRKGEDRVQKPLRYTREGGRGTKNPSRKTCPGEN